LNILVSNAEVETTRSSLATTIDQRAIENLPINGRSYIQFTLLDSATTRDNQPILAPAPTSGLNINGQRARANFVSIDGGDATDASVNGVRATLSQEAVQEFQILKSGYAPEYGRASSAVINIVSKQGTNQWRGNLFGYLRSRNVSATNAFAGEPHPGDTRTQAGETLGTGRYTLSVGYSGAQLVIDGEENLLGRERAPAVGHLRRDLVGRGTSRHHLGPAMPPNR
jgi:hypothetical protein